MSAIVTCFFEGRPLCSWGSLLGEDSTSLKTLILVLSQWNDHLNCSYLMVVLLSGPSYSSSDGTFSISGWSMIPNCMILSGVNYTLMTIKVVVSAIYCNPESSTLMRCGVLRICGVTSVVCHGRTCDCVLNVLIGFILSCFYGDCACPIVGILSGLCANHNSWSYDVCCI